MSWDAIGAIGEVVGALAVVLTLGYLAIQMRSSNKLALSEGTYSGTKLASNWRRALLQNPSLAAITVKANEGVDLTSEEYCLYHALSDEFIFACAAAYAASATSGSIHKNQGTIEYFLSVVRENNGLEKEWQRLRPIILMISTEFVQTIDDRIRTGN